MTHLANPSWCSEETRIVQALRLRLRRLHQELNEARELQYMAERHTEEHRMQCEALDDMRRHHVQEVQRLDRQSRIEQRHQASLRAQLAEVQEAIGQVEPTEKVPMEAHEALQHQLAEAKAQLLQLQGCGEELREQLREVQAKPPPKVQDLQRPAWVGDRPVAATPRRPESSSMGSPRTPSADGSFPRQVCATEALRGELAQLQEALGKELRRQKGLVRREEMLLKRQKQLKGALIQSRKDQDTGINDLNAELQEGAHHVRRLLDFAMHSPAVAAVPTAVPKASPGLQSGSEVPSTLSVIEPQELQNTPPCSAGPLPAAELGTDSPRGDK